MSGKRGANGMFWTPSGQVVLSGGAGHYDIFVRTDRGRLGDRLGSVERERHTVRTSYAGTRIGYDRTHTCWSGRFEYGKRPADMRSDSLRCYRSMTEVVEIIARETLTEPG